MINLYGKTYSKSEPEPGDNGSYVTGAGGVYISDRAGKERVFIRRDGLGPVTVTRAPNGRRFYMFATSTLDEKFLGTPDSYSEEVEGARELARSLFN